MSWNYNQEEILEKIIKFRCGDFLKFLNPEYHIEEIVLKALCAFGNESYATLKDTYLDSVFIRYSCSEALKEHRTRNTQFYKHNPIFFERYILGGIITCT
jgi:hypothetical protein